MKTKTGVKYIAAALLVLVLNSSSAKTEDIHGVAGEWEGFKAAKERIEQYRKGDLNIAVVDRDGKPVPDARIAVEMKRHSFPFGSAISILSSFDPDGPKAGSEQYLKVFAENFNAAVPENCTKWGQMIHRDTGAPHLENRSRVEACMKWLADNNIPVRGHNVVWPSREMSPKFLKDLPDDRLREEIYNRIDDAVTLYRGRFTDWDLVNEPAHHRDFMDILGEDELPYWYRRAQEIDPGTPMYVNQYDVLNGKYHAEFLRWVGLIADSGAPLGGVGIQGHVKTEQFIGRENLEIVWNILNDYAAYGLPIKITEFDCEATNGEGRQAECLENALRLFFSHPAVDGFMLWGYWDGRHWRNTERYGLDEAGFWGKDWNEKKAAKVWKRLIFDEWWTSEKMRADRDGRASLRGFLGDYTVTVTADDKVREVPVAIVRDGGTLTVTMP